jgi:carbon-monoxide dehydrogenase iron sulfur subunit
MNKIIACRVEHCLGCRSCEIACAVAHSESKDLLGAVMEHPRPQRRVTVESAGEHGLPLQCRHCEDGLCQLVCPTGAIHRDQATATVQVDEDLCIGCKLCTLMCPLGVLRIGDKNRATIKCDQCLARQADGKQPACVEACATHALQFVEADQVGQANERLMSISVVEALAGVEEAEKLIAEKQELGTRNAERGTQKATTAPAKKIKGKKLPARASKRRHVVVIGSNAAGAMAAIEAAQEGAEVTLLTADAFSYRRPAIPALIAGHMQDLHEAQIYSPATFQRNGVEVRAPVRVVALDAKKKVMTVEAPGGQKDLVNFDAAVLATGGLAARPQIAGADLAGVCTFTTAEGAREILDYTEAGQPAVVVGASFIALEVAQALLERGMTVYFNVRSRILRKLVEADLSEYLQARFAERGLRMLVGEEISAICGEAGRVEYVMYKGERIPARLVVLGTGVAPNVALAQAAGLALGESGAIAVDRSMRTSAADIYAAGDCAEVPDAGTGKFTYSAVGSTGAMAGAIAGANAAGGALAADGFLRAQADEILGVQVYSIGHSTTTAKEVGLTVTVHDLATPPEVERTRDGVRAKLITDAGDRIVGAQAVALHHGSQYAWQLYRAVTAGETREAFLKTWMSPRKRTAEESSTFKVQSST